MGKINIRRLARFVTVKDFVRREEAVHFHRRKVKGKQLSLPRIPRRKIQDHPFFGMARKTNKSVLQELKNLRGRKPAL